MAYDVSHIINLGQLKSALQVVAGKIVVMTGATGSAAGTAGLVPAPSATDNVKFLRGDGSWAEVSVSDTKVTQTIKSDNVDRPLLTAPTAQAATTTTTAAFSTNITANASTGTLTAAHLAGEGSEINVGNTSGNAVYTTTSGKLTSGSIEFPAPSAGSTPALEFITSVSQDSKGQITAYKEAVKDMVGANGSAAGAHGLVPAPAATDNTKFLKGDGTWAVPTNTDTKVNVTLGTTTKAYLLGTSTTPTSSAQAVTSIADTGVYLDTTAGHLTATQFNGSGAGIKVGSTANYAVVTTTSGKLTSESHEYTSTPTGSTPALEFIATVSQDSKGKISATKQTVKDMVGANGTAAGAHGLVPAPTATDNTKFLTGAGTWVAETTLSKGTTTGSGNAVTDISVSGHQITLTKGTTFATKEELEALGNPMVFKGTVGTGGTVTTLPSDAKVGDTYKVITAGTYGGHTCKIGDTLICTTAGSSQVWAMIPSGDEPEGTVTNVATGSGLTGGPITSTGTISHADTSSQASMITGGRTYINSITLDDFGHVTALGTNTETVTNTDEKVKQTSDTTTTTTIPLLFSAQATPTSGNAYEAKYNANVNVKPSDGTVSAPKFVGALDGNASSATAFASAQSVALTGDVTGSASSAAGWSVATTLANSGVTAGTYGPTADVTGNEGTTIVVPQITVDSKGRVTSATTKTLTNKNTTYTPLKLGFGYGSNTQSASTTARTVTLSNYELVANGYVTVKFTNAVPASATLNINSKGAKAIYYNGAAITADVIRAGDTVTFVYTDSKYYIVNINAYVLAADSEITDLLAEIFPST